MSGDVLAVVVPSIVAICTVLIPLIFSQANRRNDAAAQERQQLLDDKDKRLQEKNERLKEMEIARDEARKERDEARRERDLARQQAKNLEKILATDPEQRPTRGVK